MWKVTSKDGKELEVTPILRYVIRNGEKILQQLHLEHKLGWFYPTGVDKINHWIDVPVVEGA